MTYISEEEEAALDKGEVLTLKRGNRTMTVMPNHLYCYGEVDFSTNSDDMYQIEDFHFLDYLGAKGLHIYSDYHYDTHECHSPLPQCRWTETWNPAEIAQYAHGCLGKPQRIVLFKIVK